MTKSRSFPANTDAQRKHRTATSKAMKRIAESKKCPTCGRKNAVKRVQLDPWTVVRVCRWGCPDR
jgi:ribosomal protein L37AE/L43A